MSLSNNEYKLLAAYMSVNPFTFQWGTMCPNSPLVKESLVLFTGEPIKFFGHYYKKLGEGTYGSIWLTNKNFAVKKTNKTFETIKEIAILNHINHPNIMCTSGAYSGLNYFAFYMPLAKTSFVSEELLLELKASIDKRKTAYYQIFCGLAYLHSLYIIHADIKPDNILVFKKGGKYVYKIIDFGLSKTSSYLGLEYSLNVGTAEWKAPEIFDYLYSNTHVGHISSAVDIWSMGVIIYDIIYQKTNDTFLFLSETDRKNLLKLQHVPEILYSELNKRVYNHITNDKYNRTDSTTSFAPFEKELADLCLQKDPTKRPTALECLKHKFFDNKRKSTDLKIIEDGKQNVPNDSMIIPFEGREKIVIFFLDIMSKIYGDEKKYYASIYAARLMDIYFSKNKSKINFNDFFYKINIYRNEQPLITNQLLLIDNGDVNNVLNIVFNQGTKGFKEFDTLKSKKGFEAFVDSFNLIYNYNERVGQSLLKKSIIDDLYKDIKNVKTTAEYRDKLYDIEDLFQDYLNTESIIGNLLQLALLFVDEKILYISPLLKSYDVPQHKIIKVLDALGDDIFTPTALQYYFSKHNSMPDAKKIYEKILSSPYQKEIVDGL